MAEHNLTTLAKRLRPLMVAVTQATISVSEGPGIDAVGGLIGLGGDTILLYQSDGNPVEEYAATDAGLDLASAAVGAASDIIVIPGNAVIQAAHNLAGCAYVFPPGLVVSGQIITANGTVIVNLNSAVEDTDDVDAVIGVHGPPDGEAHLYNCRIAPVNNGSAGVQVISVTASGDLICHNCYLDGRGALGGGSGYAGYRDPESAGNLRIEGGVALGSSADDPFNE